MTTDNRQLLNALTFNALFSGISAILMLLAGTWLAAQFSLASHTRIYVLAGILAVFALQLGNIVRTGEIRRWEIAAIIAADLAWVVASAILLAIHYEALTVTAIILVDLVAFVVLAIAVLQFRGLRLE